MKPFFKTTSHDFLRSYSPSKRVFPVSQTRAHSGQQLPEPFLSPYFAILLHLIVELHKEHSIEGGKGRYKTRFFCLLPLGKSCNICSAIRSSVLRILPGPNIRSGAQLSFRRVDIVRKGGGGILVLLNAVVYCGKVSNGTGSKAFFTPRSGSQQPCRQWS